MNNILELKNIEFAYEEEKKIFSSFSLKIKKNSYNVIVGENASGKSTLSKIISGLLEPEKGEIYLNKKLARKNDLIKNIKIIFQNPDSQFVAPIVKDDMIFSLECNSVDPKKMDKIIDDISNRLNINHLLDKQVYQLSGGEKQKCAIASVLALKPQVIIFDESTSMLDLENKQKVLDLIKLLHKEKFTIIHITHELNSIYEADNIIMLKKGKLVFDGNLQSFFSLDLKEYNLKEPDLIKIQKKMKYNKFIFSKEELIESMKKEYDS